MNTNFLTRRFLDVRVSKSGDGYAINKPLLLLVALSRCYQRKCRLTKFADYENIIRNISKRLEQSINVCYPFGRLVNDGVWQIESDIELSLTGSGDLYRSELLLHDVKGGLVDEIYDGLICDKELTLSIAGYFMRSYFSTGDQAVLRAFLGFPESLELCSVREDKFLGLPISLPQAEPVDPPKEFALDATDNGFIAYLNSLHNLGAGGANALAEVQALNQYFAALYQPFPIVEPVLSALQDGTSRVVVLTGHAGDGKSTVALDVLKHLRGLPPDQPLPQALREREVVSSPSLSAPVTIVKDMSELSDQTRRQWLTEAFNQPGSWLVISNTGPLLNSLDDLGKRHGVEDIENRLLGLMHKPYAGGDLATHTLTGFPKDLVILNLTRLDNVDLGTQVLNKMLNHPAWTECTGCPAETACPLRLNRASLQSLGSVLEDRLRWVYQRLTHYEQRLTLRQMLAHLALSLTGGMDCAEARRQVEDSTAEGAEKGVEGLEKIVFSETFFGYRKGKPWEEAEGLRAITLTRRLVAGGPVAADYERQIVGGTSADWADLPEAVIPLWQRWRKNAANFNGVAWRFAVRRMLYVFGQSNKAEANIFLDTFLRSPKLRDFDRWQREKRLTLGTADQKKLRDACLRVLLECYSGFSAGQFDTQDRLYLTLRRADRAVAQPTQWVMAALPFNDFELHFDPELRLPLLRYRPRRELTLKLYLPLLDYIQARSSGELGGELARIHWAQLDTFRAELLNAQGAPSADGEIMLLRVGIDGQIDLRSYVLEPEKNTLEIV